MTWRMTLTPIVDPAQVRFMAGKTCDTRRRAGSRAVAQIVNQSGTKRVGSPQKAKFTGPKYLGLAQVVISHDLARSDFRERLKKALVLDELPATHRGTAPKAWHTTCVACV
jgi:hypothetical protein